MALFNFVRLLFFNAKVNPTDMNTYVNTDISLVYLSLLFILTLFNLLTTFIYCSKNRLHSQPDSNCEEELKQASDDPPCYNEVMANEKLYPIEKSSISADQPAGRSLPLNYLESFLSQNHSKIHFQV